MSRCLVTGAAGFIGSHLSERLLSDGHEVVGVDAFIPYYPAPLKRRHLASFVDHPAFTLHELDLRSDDLSRAVEGVEVIFHLAAMPGLPQSWSAFDRYMSCNLQATQRLLEATRESGLRHFIYGSTSSVYGRMATGDEERPLAPVSPYGVTKLAAEQLCRAYAANFGLPLTVARLFSVYGPRQRPDMAYHIFINALLRDEPITVFGDGEQSRSNTFVADCVDGLVLMMTRPEASLGQTFNVGGGEVVTINEVLALLAELLDRDPRIERGPVRPGDQRHTAADIGRARARLGYDPSTTIREGLQAQVAWQRDLFRSDSPSS